jgi:hypothetical protein
VRARLINQRSDLGIVKSSFAMENEPSALIMSGVERKVMIARNEHFVRVRLGDKPC